MKLDHDTLMTMVVVAAATFVFTFLFLLVLGKMGWITVSEGMPLLGSGENTYRTTRVQGFEGIYIDDVKMSPRGSFVIQAQNNMDSSVEITEITATNKKDTVVCTCTANPEVVEAKNMTTISCSGCVGKEHQLGDQYTIQIDIREYYTKTGILRIDSGIIDGFYRQ